MATGSVVLQIGGTQTNTYSGITADINGTLALNTGGDHAFQAVTTLGQGDLLVIGNGQTGTQAFATEPTANSIPNNTAIVVNNTGQFGTAAAPITDAIGSLLLDGGIVNMSGSGNFIDDGIVAAPSAIASTLNGVSQLVAAGQGAGFTIINVFSGTGAAAGNELTITGRTTVGGGATNVTKIGAGTVIYSGSTANTYTGQTTVDEGTLLLAKTAAAYAGALVVGNFSGTQSVRVLSNTNQLNSQPVIVTSSGTLNAASGGSIYALNLIAATAGTFTITVNTTSGSQTTAALPFNATLAQVQAALATLTTAIPNVNTDFLVALGGAPATPTTGGFYNIILQGNLANQNATVTLGTGSLTGTATTTVPYAGTTAVVGTTGTIDLRGGTVSIGNANLSVAGTITGLAYNGTTTNQIVNNFSTITTATGTGTIATVTTAAPHGYQVGQMISISGVSVAGYNGNFTITSVPTTTTFTYANATSTSATVGVVQSINAAIAASPTGATETGNTVTLTTTAAHGLQAGQTVYISGVGVAGYNGLFTIATVPTATTFTFTDAASGLAGRRWWCCLGCRGRRYLCVGR